MQLNLGQPSWFKSITKTCLFKGATNIIKDYVKTIDTFEARPAKTWPSNAQEQHTSPYMPTHLI